MAATATHIILAIKVYPKYFSGKDFGIFIVGNCFPDIRYLEVIEREKTHFSNLKITDLFNDSPFSAGMKFHSIVDDLREKYVSERGIYNYFPESEFLTQGVKFYEDRVLYEKMNNWNEVLNYFSEVYPEELAFDIKKEDVMKWHDLIIKGLSQKPGDKEIEMFVSEIGRPPEMANEMIKVANGIKDKVEVDKIINNFYDDFEELLNTNSYYKGTQNN